MFRNLSLVILSAMLLITRTSSAQVFEIAANPVDATTSGVTPFVSDDIGSREFILMETTVKNLSTDSIDFVWANISDTAEAPKGWLMIAICIGDLCLGEGGSWYDGTPQTTAPIPPGASMPLQLHIYAATDAPDGTGIYKIELNAGQQTDTAVFVLTKKATAVTAVALDNNRVSIYPNPLSAGDNLNVFINKHLKAARATIYNIIGREQMAFPVEKELNTYNVNSLAPGIYMLRLTDLNGEVITSKKFAKR